MTLFIVFGAVVVLLLGGFYALGFKNGRERAEDAHRNCQQPRGDADVRTLAAASELLSTAVGRDVTGPQLKELARSARTLVDLLR